MTEKERIEELEAIVVELQLQLEKSRNSTGRKNQVLEILRETGTISIQELSEKLGISTKNVSSQLTYLRTDGYKIFTDNRGRKFLQE